MRKTLLGASLFMGLAFTASSYAANLIQVYEQALKSDPTFKQAEAAWMLAKAQVPITRGTNALLPNIYATGSSTWTQNGYAIPGTHKDYYQLDASLNINQSLFDISAWRQTESVGTAARAAYAKYLASAQDLIVRTANAYFTVLKDSDTLRFDEAEKRALLRQLITNRQKYKVGLIAITSVYEAQSKYDNVVATEIADRNTLANDLENLRTITGHYYPIITGLKSEVPLITPVPANINNWVKIAQQQNYLIKSDQLSVTASKQAIDSADDSFLPTLSATGSVGHTKTNQAISGIQSTEPYSVGLSVNVPLYTSGSTQGKIDQAQANYANASAQYELDYRGQTNAARKAYLGVISGVSKIKADLQAIKSAKNALAATKAGYVVGTRTMVDVLNDMSTLYATQKQYTDDQYSYIMQIIALKQAAGTLSGNDLVQINKWLTKPIQVGEQSHTSTSLIKKANAPIAVSKPTEKVSFAIQYYAGHSKKSAETFINEQKNTPSLKIIHEGNWYKVISGDYKTMKTANTARKMLPSSLKKYQPWVTLVS